MSLSAGIGAICLTLASMFTDHAVLQRGGETCIWGTSTPGEEIRVRLAEKEVLSTVGADGRWQACLHDLSPGGPYELHVESPSGSVVLKDILVGDVWLCSGQSNMQWTMQDVLNPDADVDAAAALGDLRLYIVPKNGTPEPLTDIKATWTSNDKESVRNFSAVAQYFAAELRRSPAMANIPIGLIDSSFGGTRVEAWIPKPILDHDFSKFALRESLFGFTPAAMWNAMINPVVPYGIAGTLWYQGESNACDAGEYAPLLTGLITEWRRQWSRPELPFLIVQLPNHAERFGGCYFTALREAQAKVAATVPHAAMAVAIDTGDGFDVHPKTKAEIGKRLGLLARREVYGETILASGPVMEKFGIAGDSMTLSFGNSGGGLVSRTGDLLKAFSLAGADGIFRPADARIVDGKVVARTSDGSEPRFVRYAWEGNPEVSLYNAQGLPAAPFRTDDLPAAEFEIEQLPAPFRVDAGSWSMIISGDGRITSLRAGANEFLASGDPARPGAYFATDWGPSRIFDIRRVSSVELRAVIEFCTFSILTKDGAMTWRLANRKPGALKFHVALASDVATTLTPTGAECIRGKDRIIFSGASMTLSGGDLVVELAGMEEKVITVTPGLIPVP